MKYLNKIDFKFLVIVLLALVILFMKMCGNQDPEPPKGTIKINGKDHVILKHTRDTIYEPVVQTEYRDGETIYVDSIIYVDKPSVVDTSAILKNYFAMTIYKDTLKLKDSLGFITLTDTISKNKIQGRTFFANVNKIKIFDTIVVQEPKKIEFYGGGTMGFDKVNLVNFVGPTLNIKTKKDNVYGVSIGINNSKSITLQGSVLWRIKLKK
jgi:hypothetical protein